MAEFRRLVTLGQQKLGDHDPRAAVDLLGRAIGLWREPPLADVPPTVGMAEVTRKLVAEHEAASEALIEAKLALGQHRSLLPELRAQVTAHPEHERLGEQLLLALYQCGRRAEALTTYRRIGAILAERYGIDPGPGLRHLHQQILADDPVLRPRRLAPTASSGGHSEAPGA